MLVFVQLLPTLRGSARLHNFSNLFNTSVAFFLIVNAFSYSYLHQSVNGRLA